MSVCTRIHYDDMSVNQDLEFEKKQRLRSEESVQQLRAEMFEDHERHQQKDALMQRELVRLPISDHRRVFFKFRADYQHLFYRKR